MVVGGAAAAVGLALTLLPLLLLVLISLRPLLLVLVLLGLLHGLLAASLRFTFSASSRLDASLSAATCASALPVVLAPLTVCAWVPLPPMEMVSSVNCICSMRPFWSPLGSN